MRIKNHGEEKNQGKENDKKRMCGTMVMFNHRRLDERGIEPRTTPKQSIQRNEDAKGVLYH